VRAADAQRYAAIIELMLKRYLFLIASLGSVLMFAAVNLAAYVAVRDHRQTPGFSSIAIGGFPFPWYSSGDYVVPYPHADWPGITANVAIALIVSCAFGKIIKWVFVKPEPLKPKLNPFE
jgi:hypothetical protein